MSRGNLEIVQRGFDFINRGDLDGLLAQCHPDIELRPSLVGGIEQTTYRGHEGYRSWFEEQFETYDEIRFELQRLVERDDLVVALYVTRARGRASGLELEAPGGTVFELHDGLVVRQIGYQSQAEALAAGGAD